MIVLDKKADLEEQAISEEHPEYASYLLRVPKFIPNVFPKACCNPNARKQERKIQLDAEPKARAI